VTDQAPSIQHLYGVIYTRVSDQSLTTEQALSKIAEFVEETRTTISDHVLHAEFEGWCRLLAFDVVCTRGEPLQIVARYFDTAFSTARHHVLLASSLIETFRLYLASQSRTPEWREVMRELQRACTEGKQSRTQDLEKFSSLVEDVEAMLASASRDQPDR
jgi:hypothetical protein